MPNNNQSAMLEILKKIQSDVSEIKARLSGTDGRLDGMDTRLERLEAIVKKQRRDSAAMLVMMRGTVGVFEERMTDIEEGIRLIKERS